MNAATINLRFALTILGERPTRPAIDLAILAVKDALAAANHACDNEAKATCLRIINWLRAAMRAVGS